MVAILRLQGLSEDYEWCATCLIAQKAAILNDPEVLRRIREAKGLVTILVSPIQSLPMEISVTVGPSTILGGPNSVCFTHLIADNPNASGRQLAIGKSGDVKMRGFGGHSN